MEADNRELLKKNWIVKMQKQNNNMFKSDDMQSESVMSDAD